MHLLEAFHEGLDSTGRAEGQNVTLDVRRANGRYADAPRMMAEAAAKAATSTIPVPSSDGAARAAIEPVLNLEAAHRLDLALPPSSDPDARRRGDRMKRRQVLLAGIAASAAFRAAEAQAMPRVGFLIAGDPEPTWDLFRKAMTGLGWVEGRTVVYEFRAADSVSGRLDQLATELVALKIDVIVSVLSPATAAASRTTKTIPIVFNGGAVATGVVRNMARPEGNITGAFAPSSTIAGKGVQLFHEVRPETTTIGLLLNAADPFHVPLLRDIEPVGRAQKLEIVPVLLGPGDDLGAAFDTMASRGVGGVMVQPSLGLAVIATRALQAKLPAFSFRREFAEAGGLFSYGADQAEINRTIASQVDRLLKGAKPADIPVQQAAKVELVINRRTARALGLDLPPLFVASADEVID